jgi:hypothetical protein
MKDEYTPLPKSNNEAPASQVAAGDSVGEYTSYDAWRFGWGGTYPPAEDDAPTEEIETVHFCHLNAVVKVRNTQKDVWGEVPVQPTRLTVAYSFDPEVQVLKFGVAFCSPSDNFAKAKGREIALERLLNPACDMYLMRTSLYHVDIKKLLIGIIELAVNNGGDLLGIPNSWLCIHVD